jgi:steroid delta-isomerase-like uncharacterized protein
MNAIEAVKRYVDAWNRHDADAIVALFAEGGTYSNPMAGQGLTGQAIASFAKGLFTVYPDACFEIVSIGDTGGGLVAWQWLARGTNSGPLADGSPPTGRSLLYRARASLKWRVTRFGPSRPIMTDRRLMSNCGSKPLRVEPPGGKQ